MCVKPHPLGKLDNFIMDSRAKIWIGMAGNLLANWVMVSVNRLFLCKIRQ